VKYLRRLWKHVTRRTALLALLLAIGAAGLIAVAGPSSVVGQTGLVVVGVLLTYVLLPSQPAQLWNVEAHSLAQTIPKKRLMDASRAITEAVALQAAEDESKVIARPAIQKLWESSVQGIEDVIDNPSRLLLGLGYYITVTLADPAPPIVRTTVSADRCVPRAKDDQVWFSFCSDSVALAAEFLEHDNGCLSREIVEPHPTETYDGWCRRVATYRVDLTVNGRPAARRANYHHALDPDRSYFLRVAFDGSELKSTFVPTTLHVELEGSPGMRTYPVKFTSYWVVGGMDVSFQVEGQKVNLEVDEYISATHRNVHVRQFQGLAGQGWEIEAGQDNVLPPGSGAVFSWNSTPSHLLSSRTADLGDLVGVGTPLSPLGPAPDRRLECVCDPGPLVEISGVPVLDAYAILGLLPKRQARCRAEVLKRLKEANSLLPDGFSLIVLDAYRTISEQEALRAHYSQSGSIEGYVAGVSADLPRPPHVTGGAVDITLGYKGQPLALGTDYDSFMPAAHYDAFESEDTPVRRLRRALAAALTKAGFVGYPLEWWHWSYGDDWWAASNGCEALFEVVDEQTL
jgi:D-alanyl-D-alanine dipeptidase